uniref:CRAL-TRIO domain-containing protein n=1 Tax=Odontella aurita TaxID=265563 RepID=A0A7S4IZC4_9STRA|mmetsp:Transcript_33542/g.99955  ORF Transcript_33542/g.99955 Transcript_33542/m.99955 type:complete len:657 (+) Transcript_33542:1180-3150(+)
MTLCGTMSDDTIALSSGFLHLMTAWDAFGRAIIFADPSKHHATIYSRESMLRVFWYLIHVATEDPVIRRRGVVFMMYPRHGAWHQFDASLFRSMAMLGFKYMCPMTRAVHLCHPGHMFHIINPILKFIFDGRLRKRFKVHIGTEEAVLSNLRGFGLARDILPSELGGRVHLNQIQWISDRMVLEGLNGRFSPVPATTATAPPKPKVRTQSNKLPGNFSEANLDLDAELDNIESIISSMAKEPADAHKTPSASTSDVPSLPATLNGLVGQQPTREIENAMAAKRSQERQSRHIDEVDDTFLEGLISTICAPAAASNKHTTVNIGKPTNKIMHDATGSFSQALDRCNVDSIAEARTSFYQGNSSMGNTVLAPPRRKAKSRGVAAVQGGDPRMKRAIAARLADPHLPLLDALIKGGFKFPAKKEKGISDKSIMDGDGVSLYQRKNQLNRRLRERRREDPRMARAVAAIRTNPNLSLREALVEGGYEYHQAGSHNAICDRTVKDAGNVSLHSRKTELKKRLVDLDLQDPAASENIQTGALSGVHESNGSMTWPHVKRDGNQRVAPGRVKRVSGCDDDGPTHASLPNARRIGEMRLPPAGVNVEKGLCIKKNDSFDESIKELPGLADLDEYPVAAPVMRASNEPLMGTWLWGGTEHSPLPC